MTTTEIITAFIGTIPSLTAPLIETWLKPKLSEAFKAKRIDDQLIRHSFENKFQEYLNRSYEQYSIVNTLAFHNQQKLLKNLYIPLTVNAENKNTELKIDEYNKDFIPVFKKVLITDTAGMGKSTLLKWTFLSIVEKNEGIPIVIELRKLNKKNSILEEITGQLSPINEQIDNKFILELILRGDFIFLFDGFDEIPFDDRKEVSSDLKNFISKANKNLFVITSRPESALSSFGDFQQFNINPLTKMEAYELLQKYDESNEVATTLIAKIEESSYSDISEFLANPMLVSLLFTAFEFKHIIPLKKHIFYRQVYDALFERHDLTKGDFYIREKHSNLDSDDFHRIMRFLGFSTMKLGKIEYTKDEILKQISQAKGFNSSLDFNEADLLYDLITSVPLFIEDGNYYRWAHKSIQDYFTAQFICTDTKGQQEEILIKLYRSKDFDKYINVMELAYDIDLKSFRRSVIYESIKDLLHYHDNSYQTLKFDKSLIEERQSLTYNLILVVIKDDEFDSSKVNADPRILHELSNLVAPYFKKKQANFGVVLAVDKKKFNNTLVFHSMNYTNKCLSFLANKKLSFITSIDFIEQTKLFRKSKDKIEIELENKKPYLVSDDPSLPFNQNLDYFKQLNNLIKMHARPTYLFNFDMARQELDNIEKEIREESKSDFFI